MAYSDLQLRAFTQIAYMDLDEKYVDYCKENATNVAPLAALLDDYDFGKLINLGIKEEEIASWSISGIHNTNSENGFYACIIETDFGEGAAVGFRGSENMAKLDNLVNDWVGADIGLVNSTCTNQQEEVERFLKKYQVRLDKYDKLTMTGHSLGGNLAEYATIVSYKYGLDENIEQCASMDGPGFSEEFINKYSDKIQKMADVMYHPRWSFVGTMLNDLPGVKYRYVKVSNEANSLDKAKYNCLTRHDTKYLVFDGNGSLTEDKQDGLSMVTSVISEGMDHLPTPIGNAWITVVSGALIGFTWARENFLNEDGTISNTGLGIVAASVGTIAAFGFNTVAMAVAGVVVAMVAVVAVAVVTELVYDAVSAAADTICEAVSKICDWVSEKYQQFAKAVKSIIDKVKNQIKSNYNSNYQYASSHPQIKVNTYKLEDYASRINDINRRISALDGRMDNLYWHVGLRDLWNLMQADLLTQYSQRLRHVASYLNDTASEFVTVEQELLNGISG